MDYDKKVYEMTGEKIQSRTFPSSGFIKLLYVIYQQNKKIIRLLNRK